MQFANPRPLPPQIIYLATLPSPSPGKRPKALKHANTFPPDKTSSSRLLLPARLESPIKSSSTSRDRKRSSATLAREQPEYSTPRRVSRKRSAPSELPSSDHQDIPERAVKKAKQTIAALPMSPPETPDKTIELARKISLNGKATVRVGPPIALPMSPPSSPPDKLKSKAEEHKTSLFGASKRTDSTTASET
jgi:hypothetical protein